MSQTVRKYPAKPSVSIRAQLVVQAAARRPAPAPHGGGRSGRRPPSSDQVAQVGDLAVAGRHREVGQPGSHQAEVEGALGGDLRRLLHRPRVPPRNAAACSAPDRRCAPPRTPAATRRARRAGAASPDAGHDRCQPAAGGGRVVDGVGGDRGRGAADGELGEGVVARRVEGVAVVEELHGDVLAARRRSISLPNFRGRRQRGRRSTRSAKRDRPLTRQPVRTTKWPAVASPPSASSSKRGSPFTPPASAALRSRRGRDGRSPRDPGPARPGGCRRDRARRCGRGRRPGR